MKLLLKGLREELGRVIVCGDHLTRSQSLKRDETLQAKIDEATKKLSLYQFHACPFCVKTRRAIHHLGLNIELRDAQNNALHRQTLAEEGGKIKVPCLRIENDDGSVRYLYESDEIIDYLNSRFS